MRDIDVNFLNKDKNDVKSVLSHGLKQLVTKETRITQDR